MIVRLNRKTAHALEVLAARCQCTVPQAIEAAISALFPNGKMPDPPEPGEVVHAENVPVREFRVRFWGKPLKHAAGAPWAEQDRVVKAVSAKDATERAKSGFRMRPGIQPGWGGKFHVECLALTSDGGPSMADEVSQDIFEAGQEREP